MIDARAACLVTNFPTAIAQSKAHIPSTIG